MLGKGKKGAMREISRGNLVNTRWMCHWMVSEGRGSYPVPKK